MTTARLDIIVDSTGVATAGKSLDDLAKKGAEAEKSTDTLGKTSKTTSDSVFTLSNAAKTAAGAMALYLTVKPIIEYSDAWNNAANQLRLVTGSASELASMQRTLMGVSQDTRSEFGATAELYSRLARSTTDLGLTGAELVGITKTINQSFAVSGASAQEAEGAIRQLAQGFAAGALRGDEFNSVAENAPGIMDAIAKSLNMTRGELRGFAADGGITAEIVVTALQQAASTIETDFAKANITFGQSATMAKNNVMEFIGTNEALQAAVGGSSKALVAVTENLDHVAAAAGIVAVGMAGQYVTGMVAAGGAMTTATAAATALRTVLMTLVGPAGLITLAAGAMYLLVQRQKELAEKNYEVATSFDLVLAKLGAMSQLDLARQIQQQRELIDGLTEQRDGHLEVAKANGITSESARRLTGQIVIEEDRMALLVRQLRGLQDGTRTLTTETETLTGATVTLISNTEFLDGVYRNIGLTVSNTADAYVDLMGVSDTTTTAMLQDVEDLDAILNQMGGTLVNVAEINTATTLESQRQWTATRDYLADSFIDIANNGGSAFEKIGDAFSAMIQRMIAEWAAAKVMSWFGMSSPMGNTGPAATATGTIFNAGTNAVISKVAPSIAKTLGIGTAATTGIAAGTAVSGTAGVSTVYAAGTAATSAAGLTSTAIGTGAATTGAAGGITGTLAAVPVWGWVAAAALAAAAYLDKPTPSSNAGMLLHDVPGAKPDQKFSVDPFDSGLAPVGFSRRESQAEAIAVIDVFRQYDSALTGLAKTAGLSVNLDASTFRAIGLNEEGRGDGVFLGDAGQKDKPGKPLQDQLDSYVTAYIESLQDQINPEAYQRIISAGNADAMLAAAAESVSRIDGSHASGLDYVPFDNYRANLHQGERVQTAAEARSSDATAAEVKGLRLDMKNMMIAFNSIVVSSNKSARALDEAIKNGAGTLAVTVVA